MCDSFSLNAITNVDKVLSINIPGRPHAYSVTKSIYHIAVNITYGLQFGSSQPANPWKSPFNSTLNFSKKTYYMQYSHTLVTFFITRLSKFTRLIPKQHSPCSTLEFEVNLHLNKIVKHGGGDELNEWERKRTRSFNAYIPSSDSSWLYSLFDEEQKLIYNTIQHMIVTSNFKWIPLPVSLQSYPCSHTTNAHRPVMI